MKKYMLLHFGFTQPTPEIMEAWGKWFEQVSDRAVEHGGLGDAREITHQGSKDIPWGMESITGYSIINAAGLDEAQQIAQSNPFIASIRICEIREH